jgi:hypothetical protein
MDRGAFFSQADSGRCVRAMSAGDDAACAEGPATTMAVQNIRK